MGRLDQYVTSQLEGHSRAYAEKLIEQGHVLVNGQPQLKGGYRLRENDEVKVNYDEQKQAKIPSIDLPVIYEDKACVVFNKPAGVLSHSKGAFNPEATVATWLAGRVPDLAGERAGIVHRLDRGTSGVMIGAKTPEALAWLQKQFSERKVKKTYIAVVSGELNPAEAIIDMPIERNPKKPQSFRAGNNGKPATTAYKVLKTNGSTSWLELKPTTGRTHQLRVHLKQIGHPIIGDSLYGGKPADRLYLHALSLELTLPNKSRQTFEAPLPPEFKEVIK